MIGLLVCMYKLAVKEKLWQAGLHLFVHGKYLKEEELISKGDILFHSVNYMQLLIIVLRL